MSIALAQKMPAAVETHPTAPSYHNFVPSCKKLICEIAAKIKLLFQSIIQWLSALFNRAFGSHSPSPASGKSLPAPSHPPSLLNKRAPTSPLPVSPLARPHKIQPLMTDMSPAVFEHAATLPDIQVPKNYQSMLVAFQQQQPKVTPIENALKAFQKLAPPIEEVTKTEKLMGVAATVHFLSLPSVAAGAIANYGLKHDTASTALTSVTEIAALSAAGSIAHSYSPLLGYTFKGLAWASSIAGLAAQASLTGQVTKWIDSESRVEPQEIEQVKALIPYAPKDYSHLYNLVIEGKANKLQYKKLVQVAAAMNPQLSQGLALAKLQKEQQAVQVIGAISTAACSLMVTQLLTDSLFLQLSAASITFTARYLAPAKVHAVEDWASQKSQLAISKAGGEIGIKQTLVCVGMAKQITYFTSWIFEEQAAAMLGGSAMMLGSVAYQPIVQGAQQWKALTQKQVALKAEEVNLEGEALQQVKVEQAQVTALKASVVAQGLFSIGVRGVAYYATDSLVSGVTGMPMAGHIAGATASVLIGSVADKTWSGVCYVGGKVTDKAWSGACYVGGKVKGVFNKFNPFSSSRAAQAASPSSVSHVKIEELVDGVDL